MSKLNTDFSTDRSGCTREFLQEHCNIFKKNAEQRALKTGFDVNDKIPKNNAKILLFFFDLFVDNHLSTHLAGCLGVTRVYAHCGSFFSSFSVVPFFLFCFCFLVLLHRQSSINHTSLLFCFGATYVVNSKHEGQSANNLCTIQHIEDCG